MCREVLAERRQQAKEAAAASSKLEQEELKAKAAADELAEREQRLKAEAERCRELLKPEGQLAQASHLSSLTLPAICLCF